MKAPTPFLGSRQGGGSSGDPRRSPSGGGKSFLRLLLLLLLRGGRKSSRRRLLTAAFWTAEIFHQWWGAFRSSFPRFRRKHRAHPLSTVSLPFVLALSLAIRVPFQPAHPSPPRAPILRLPFIDHPRRLVSTICLRLILPTFLPSTKASSSFATTCSREQHRSR